MKDNNKLDDLELESVTGGYKAFDESLIHGGVVLKGIDIAKPSQVTYLLVYSGDKKTGVYSCKQWVLIEDKIVIDGIEIHTTLSDANTIYVIEDNPPSYVTY